MRVLVTGVAGFIGSHLAERLVSRGDDVVGFDNFDPFYAREKKELNIAPLRASITLVEGDLLDRALVEGTISQGRFDAVAHLAALAGVRPSIAEPARYQHVNVVGTANLADAIVAHGVPRLVFASSSSVYGDNQEVPYSESHRVDLPASPYAVSKRACELLLRSYHVVHGLSSCCLRYFTVYGPRQRPEMAIHKFCQLMRSGSAVPMFGDGTTSRDYTFIDDIVDGTLGALDHAPAGHTIYTLGGTSPVRLRDLIAEIGEALGVEPRIDRQPLQAGDVMHTWADVSAARRDLGYDPKVSLREGLRRFVTWMDQSSERERA